MGVGRVSQPVKEMDMRLACVEGHIVVCCSGFAIRKQLRLIMELISADLADGKGYSAEAWMALVSRACTSRT